jgi:hypothetical protein
MKLKSIFHIPTDKTIKTGVIKFNKKIMKKIIKTVKSLDSLEKVVFVHMELEWLMSLIIKNYFCKINKKIFEQFGYILDKLRFYDKLFILKYTKLIDKQIYNDLEWLNRVRNANVHRAHTFAKKELRICPTTKEMNKEYEERFERTFKALFDLSHKLQFDTIIPQYSNFIQYYYDVFEPTPVNQMKKYYKELNKNSKDISIGE